MRETIAKRVGHNNKGLLNIANSHTLETKRSLALAAQERGQVPGQGHQLLCRLPRGEPRGPRGGGGQLQASSLDQGECPPPPNL